MCTCDHGLIAVDQFLPTRYSHNYYEFILTPGFSHFDLVAGQMSDVSLVHSGSNTVIMICKLVWLFNRCFLRYMLTQGIVPGLVICALCEGRDCSVGQFVDVL